MNTKFRKESPATTAAAIQSSLKTSEMKARARFAADEYRNALLTKAKQEGVGIVHLFDKTHPYGGYTVAFQRASKYTSGRMVRLAVANCSPEDVFNKRVGTTIALDNFFDGKTIEMSILVGYEGEDINGAVKTAFSMLPMA